ncbi:diguanylate cyclase [Enemella dayhoffiae]|uniref:Diguanylate cyclase n=1 Tax=Enemella dayhoffiae TaxID=2016507 RepID=A0A255GPQ2_9ACTN|nr:ABC transporter permease [Enemella dayhoffiae]OYO16546.1 diguanylate cyclase [Enemella dayhoffiae]
MAVQEQRAHRHESPLSRFWRRFRAHPINVVAAAGVLLLLVIGIIGPWIAPADPLLQDINARRLGPFSPGHLLGTDHLGRDLLSQLLHGARVAVQAAGIAVGVGIVLGVPTGLLSGYVGGWLDSILSRLADALLTFPPLLLAMAIVGVMGPNLRNAMGAIGLVFAPRFFRIVRASVLSVREATYIEAAHSIGTPTVQILRRHVLPNVLSPIIVQISLATGFAILAEASLSYLGLGVRPPAPSWGRMLNDGRASWFYTTWPVLLPAVTIILSVLVCNLLGDGTRDSLGREERGGGAR